MDMSIYKKLLKIQEEVLGLGKDKDGFGYKYVTGSKVLDHIKPLMNESGIILKQEILSIDNCRQDYNTKNGSKSEILSKVMMRFTWIDCETGEKDENLFGANGQNDWDKGVGSALTYAERYFLLKYFHINTDEDDIDNPERDKNKTAPVTPTQPPKQNVKSVDNKILLEVSEKLAEVKTEDELKALAKEYSKVRTANPNINGMFTNKKIALNGNK